MDVGPLGASMEKERCQELPITVSRLAEVYIIIYGMKTYLVGSIYLSSALLNSDL